MRFALSKEGYGLLCSNPYGLMGTGVSLEQARFETIVDELRELKKRVKELEAKLKTDENNLPKL